MGAPYQGHPSCQQVMLRVGEQSSYSQLEAPPYRLGKLQGCYFGKVCEIKRIVLGMSGVQEKCL